MPAIQSAEVATWNQQFTGQPPQKLLAWAAEQFGDQAALACSFGMEDVALVDMIARLPHPLPIFVLDTGRLHESTYETMEACRSKYNIHFELYFPDAAAVETLTRSKGLYSFYESVENRKECCRIRKVLPLQRALQGRRGWITGLRREQSAERNQVELIEVDEAHGGILKLNPLAEWTTEQLQTYLAENKVPVHPLHARGYPSIGCEPCTRAIEPGEDLRAGRWWWESSSKECGIHER